MSALKAIADGIAARFEGVTATMDGATEAIVLGPTASLPDTVREGPALLVFHPTGVLDVVTSRIRRDEHDFPVWFLRDPLSYPERSDWLYAWYDALRDRVEMDIDLGLPYVAWARPVASAVELDGGEYAGTTYDLIELTVRVHINEIVTTLAI